MDTFFIVMYVYKSWNTEWHPSLSFLPVMFGGKEYPWMLCSKHSLHQIFVLYLNLRLNWSYYIARKNWMLLVTRVKLSLSFKCVLMTSILIDSIRYKSAGAA